MVYFITGCFTVGSQCFVCMGSLKGSREVTGHNWVRFDCSCCWIQPSFRSFYWKGERTIHLYKNFISFSYFFFWGGGVTGTVKSGRKVKGERCNSVEWAAIQPHAAISRLSHQDAPGSALLPGSFHPIISPSDRGGNEVVILLSDWHW